MTFEDLSAYDINLIKGMAVEKLAFTRCTDRYVALVDVVLNCIRCKGFNLVPNDPTIHIKIVAELQETKRSGYGSTRDSKTPEEIIKGVFEYLFKHEIKVDKDLDREVTWKQPSDAWYSRVPVHKKPWVI